MTIRTNFKPSVRVKLSHQNTDTYLRGHQGCVRVRSEDSGERQGHTDKSHFLDATQAALTYVDTAPTSAKPSFSYIE
jgi:hypothetical protein